MRNIKEKRRKQNCKGNIVNVIAVTYYLGGKLANIIKYIKSYI